jgi:hypothetical protein
MNPGGEHRAEKSVYNRQRCHSATGYLAPLAYEQLLQTNGIGSCVATVLVMVS